MVSTAEVSKPAHVVQRYPFLGVQIILGPRLSSQCFPKGRSIKHFYARKKLGHKHAREGHRLVFCSSEPMHEG